MANTKDFLLPDLGEGLTEGEIVSWLVAVGDVVDVDQPVAEVETAKAVVEVPSPFAGTVTALHGEVGQEVEVGKPLVTIDLDGGAATPAAPAQGTPGDVPDEGEVSDLVPEPEDETDEGSGNVLVGYGTGRGGRSRRRRGGAPAGPPNKPEPQGRPLAKPPVRKLAKDLGVDLTEVEGSGPDGIITRDDVHSFAGNGQPAPAEAPAQPAAAQPAPQAVVAQPVARADGERIPLRGVRKAIAEKMTTSRREIPEATTWVDCDATGLWELREELNLAQTDVRVSPLAIVLRAVVAGLRKFPDLNASLDTQQQEIVLHRHVNLGFAAQTERGLVVPVIKQADRRSTLDIASELNRLAAAARAGSVKPDEMTGGTFTVSNYGSFGVDGGSAVINHPEAAILGVGRISERPWVVDSAIAVRKVMQLSIAFDHRICDGGEAAGFLRFLADVIENPTKLVASL
jgi:2-oxoisovalerate dehydrogenase E2 component (dihydrolipoyl transacylase)